MRRALALGTAVALVVLAACSGDDDSASDAKPAKDTKESKEAATAAKAKPSAGCDGKATA